MKSQVEKKEKAKKRINISEKLYARLENKNPYQFSLVDESRPSGEELLNVKQMISRNKYVNYSNYINLRMGRRRYTWAYFLVGIALLVALTVVLLVRSGAEGGIGIAAYVIMIALLLAMLKSIAHPYFDIGRFRRRWDNHGLLKSGYNVRILKDGLIVENADDPAADKVFVDFENLKAICSMKEHYLFVADAGREVFIPVSKSSLPEDSERFILNLPVEFIEKE